MHPFHPKTHYELSLLYTDLEKKKEAKKHMEICVDIWKDADPEYSLAIKAKEKLKEFK